MEMMGRQNMGVTAHELARMLLSGPDLDVMVEDVAHALTMSHAFEDGDHGRVPNQRARAVTVAYTRPDYEDMNHDIDVYLSPNEAYRHRVVCISGVNTEYPE